MIQDIGQGRYRNEYEPAAPGPDDRVICRRGRELFIKKRENTLVFPTYREVTEQFPKLAGTETYLFKVDEIRYYLFREVGTAAEKMFTDRRFPGFSWENINILRTIGPKEAAFAAVTGFQLAEWYGSRRFCPRCGERLAHDEKERMMRCPSCGQTEYPKISPAVIVGVTNGEKLLLTKYAGRDFKRYALIAGFAEIGETIEETVRREVMEETGVRVKNIRYYKSQPWSFSGTLLMGFFADLDGDDTIRLDEEELSEGVWCTREEVPEDDGISLTREMMRVFKCGMEI